MQRSKVGFTENPGHRIRTLIVFHCAPIHILTPGDSNRCIHLLYIAGGHFAISGVGQGHVRVSYLGNCWNVAGTGYRWMWNSQASIKCDFGICLVPYIIAKSVTITGRAFLNKNIPHCALS